jgi:dipeptidyl-peptidase-4
MSRDRDRSAVVAGRVAIAAGCLVACATAGAAAQGPIKRHSLDRLYSLPWIIGKEPRGFAWSPDSKRLAFLWNDEGINFADVWVVAADSGAPQRVTSMPRPAVAPTDTGLRALQGAVAVETDPGVAAVQWFPDGRRLLTSFRGDLFQTVPGQPPVRLTETRGAETRPAFSADGRQLAYLLDGELWVGAVGDGALTLPARVVAARAGTGVESFRWSPTGDRLAFVEVDRTAIMPRIVPDYLTDETSTGPLGRPYPGEEPESRRLGVVTRSGGAPRWIDLGPDATELLFSYAWAPNGSAVLVDKSDLFVKDRRLLVADPATGATRVLRRETDPNNVSAEWWADWAPDGKGVYYTSDRDEDYHVYYQPLNGGAPSRVTSGAWAVFRAEVSAGASHLVVVTNEGRGEERHLATVPLGGGKPTRRSVRPGTHTPTVSPDGRYAAVLFSSDSVPPDLLITRLTEPIEERRVTSSPRPDFREYRWVTPRYVTFQQHQDGVTLHGRLILPPDFDSTKRYPAILGSVYSNTVRNQWGGRNAHPTWGLDQYLAQEGYVILAVDISGSSGRGKAFRQRIKLDYGGIDVEDLYSGALYLKSLGFVDVARIGIWGSSYGGLLTTMSLFTKPGVYKAGIAGAPATNVWHALTGEMRVMMRPQDQWEQYAAASSHTKARGLQDHLMIIHGMRDRVVLFKDSITLVELLMQYGKDVDLVALPNSGHGWDNEGLYQTRFAFQKMVDFFDKHLRLAGKPAAR